MSDGNSAREQKHLTAVIRKAAKTTLVSHNIRIDGRRTSVRLEPDMWRAFLEIAERERRSVDDIATDIARLKKPDTSLTAGLRVFIMAYFRDAATEEGHQQAGHGLEEGNMEWTGEERFLKARLALIHDGLSACA